MFIILFGTNGFTQKDTLNNFNSNGKKDGVWKVYLDDSVNPIDSADVETVHIAEAIFRLKAWFTYTYTYKQTYT